MGKLSRTLVLWMFIMIVLWLVSIESDESSVAVSPTPMPQSSEQPLQNTSPRNGVLEPIIPETGGRNDPSDPLDDPGLERVLTEVRRFTRTMFEASSEFLTMIITLLNWLRHFNSELSGFILLMLCMVGLGTNFLGLKVLGMLRRI